MGEDMIMEKKCAKKTKSAVDTMIAWKYNPSAIEKKVNEKPLSDFDKSLIKKYKF